VALEATRFGPGCRAHDFAFWFCYRYGLGSGCGPVSGPAPSAASSSCCSFIAQVTRPPRELAGKTEIVTHLRASG